MKTESWKHSRGESSHARTKRIVSSHGFASEVARAETASTTFLKPAGATEDPRRSHRVLLRLRTNVHLALKGKVTTLPGVTLSVHDRGAVIVLQRSLPVDARLVLENSATREKIACKIARPARETPEGYHTTIEFDSPSQDFWKIAFPPSDWRPDDV